MSSPDAIEPRRPPTVFLSYASQDRNAVQSIRDALPGLGLEVWYDESDLTGGDAWDQKIRRQIRECDFFMPVVSAQTEVRPEGYFRREWRLAVERTLDMADDHTFLLPVVIDDTGQAGARVPDKFLAVQWLRLPGGQPTPAFEALCRRLAAGEAIQMQPPRKASALPLSRSPPPQSARPDLPEFPREEPGQKARFWAHVMGWGLKSGWLLFSRLPRWVRWLVYCWLAVVLLNRGCTSHDEGRRAPKISAPSAEKLERMEGDDAGNAGSADLAKLGAQIAREAVNAEKTGTQPELLAIPFTAPRDDASARKLAHSAFELVYGKLTVSLHGQLGLAPATGPAVDTGDALDLGRTRHSTYVLYGGVDPDAPAGTLTVKIASVADGSVLWTASYPVASTDPEKIAADVNSKVSSLHAASAPQP